MALAVHNMPPPALEDAHQTRDRVRKGRWRMLMVLAVCAAPVVASYFTYFVIRPEARNNYSDLIQPTRSWPEGLKMTGLDGQPVAPASLKGQWILLAVGPSTCDAACDKRLFMQRQLREMMGRERERLDKVWLLTDTAPLAPALQAALDAAPAVTVLRVDAKALANWLSPQAGRALEEHLYVVDPMGEWMMRLPAEPDPSKVKSDLSRLLKASAFWDQPGR